jgi:Ca-activated chloride channel family protein
MESAAQRIKRKGRDVVILLDTSRSMLAEDIKPSRLERSKIAIADLLEILEETAS